MPSFRSRLSIRTGPLSLVLGLLLLGGACTSTAPLRSDDPGVIREEIERLKEARAASPDDPEIQRDLGALYVRIDRPDSARRQLERAYAERPEDPKTLFFLGVAQEKLGNDTEALDLYGQYTSVPPDSRYRSLLRGRHEELRYTRAREEIRASMDRPGAGADGPSPRTVAVVPFTFSGQDSTYAPLGRGLGELVLNDLSNVERLRVVERIRLQALLDELQLGLSDAVASETAPRVGALLGAGRLVGGSFAVEPRRELRIDASLVRLEGAVESPEGGTAEGPLEEYYRLVNEIVFGLVDRFGIELTAEERADIEQVPTRNLQAFLAYSRGLRAEDRGNYGQARLQYEQAATQDPSFRAASEARDRAQSRDRAGDPEDAVAATVPQPDPIDLTQLRQQNTAAQSTPSREPAEESRRGDAAVLEGAPPLPRLDDVPR